MDGYVTPTPKKKADIQEVGKSILNSKFGMAQNPASTKNRQVNHTLVDELKYIIRTEKDIFSNINATAKWLRDQPDFEERNLCRVYDNCLIGYDPRNLHFQRATTYFWKLYSSEEYTWRDQPFWCFTLDKLGITPVLMGGSRHDFFTIHSTNKAPGHHKYNDSHENNAIKYDASHENNAVKHDASQENNSTGMTEVKKETKEEKRERIKARRKRRAKLVKISNLLDATFT